VRSRLALALGIGALTALSSLSACILDWKALRGGADDSGADDSGDGGPTDTGPPLEACTPKLVINELKADGVSSADEFVELYNSASCTASLQGYAMQYSSQAGSTPLTIWNGAIDDIIEGNGYFLLIGEGFTPPPNAHVRHWQNLNSPANGILSKSGGGVGLFAPQAGNVLIDAVAYATISTPTHPFIRPAKLPDGGASTPAPNPPTNQSIARIPNGASTDTNATDFKVAATSPGAPN
jgi:hypothetical protein